MSGRVSAGNGRGFPSLGTLTDVVGGGTGMFAGASGNLSGSVRTGGPDSAIKLAGMITLVPGVSVVLVGAIAVTVTPGGTEMVCDPPLYWTVSVPPATPLLVPFVIRAAPLVIREAPTLPFVIVLRLLPPG